MMYSRYAHSKYLFRSVAAELHDRTHSIGLRLKHTDSRTSGYGGGEKRTYSSQTGTYGSGTAGGR